MSFTSRSFLLTTILLSGLLISSGCQREPAPEEMQADEALKRARGAAGQYHHDQVRQLLHIALTLDRKSGRSQQLAEECELLGESYTATAQFDSAFIFLEEAYEHYKAVADRASARRVKLSAAFLHRWIGEESKGFAIYDEMLRIARVLGDGDGVTEIQWAMLPSCRVLDRREQEAKILTELLNVSTTSKETGTQAKVYREWGRSYLYVGHYGSAVENFLRAFSLANQAGDSLLSIASLADLAQAYMGQGRTGEAFQAYTDALIRSDLTPAARELREEMLVRVGNAYLRDRQYADAERFFRSALRSAMERANRLAEGYLLIQLGHCAYEQISGREEAVKNYRLALDLFNSYSYGPGSAYALASLGLATYRGGRPSEALGYFASSVEHLEAMPVVGRENDLHAEYERVFYNLHQTSPSDAYIEVLLLLGKNEEAFVQTEMNRGRQLADVFGEFALDTDRQETTAALWEFTRQKALHAGAVRQLAQALGSSSADRFVLEQIHASIKRHKRLADEAVDRVSLLNKLLEMCVKTAGVTLSEVQKALSPGTLVIKPVPTSRSVYVFAVSSSKVVVQLSAVEKPRFWSLLRDYHQALSSSSQYADSALFRSVMMQNRMSGLSASLYSAVLRPVESQIAGAEKIILIPPDSLVPFHALRKSGRAGSYLIQSHQVTYLPSALALLLPPTGGDDGGIEIVAMGHPGSTDWDVEYELRDIRAFYKDARFYFGKQATFSTLQKERGTLLHLAAEFHFDSRSPGNSDVVFSDGQSSATTRTIQWGKLLSVPRFTTVIVSDLSREEGIPLTKPALFLLSGDESVVLSLYTPRRKTKKYFGELFYTSLIEGRSTQESYRKAILGMIGNADYAAPYVWAPFFLWGK